MEIANPATTLITTLNLCYMHTVNLCLVITFILNYDVENSFVIFV